MFKLKQCLNSAILLLLLYCASDDTKSRQNLSILAANRWVFEGWACEPRGLLSQTRQSPIESCDDSTTKDYLYLKFFGKASEKALAKSSSVMKQSSCSKEVKEQLLSVGLEKVVGEYIGQVLNVQDAEFVSHRIMTQTKDRISEVGLYGCCSLNTRTGKCADVSKSGPDEWEECLCVGYFHYSGGRKSFEKQVKKAIEL